MNCFCKITASARLWLYLKSLYFISSAIAYCISPYASFYTGLSCFYLRQIRSIRMCLPTNAAKSLVNAFVISRLDYCNCLYANIQQGQIDRLQSVLNVAARLIFGASRFSHVTPLLRDRLHWLRIRELIQFKLCLIVYKALNGMVPSYLSNLCITEDINELRRTLRSALTSTMTHPTEAYTFDEV